MRSMLLRAAAFLLALSGPSDALALTYVANSTGTTVLQIRVEGRSSDAEVFTDWRTYRWGDLGGSSFTAEAEQIAATTPELRIDNFVTTFGPITYSDTIGSSLSFTLELDSVVVTGTGNPSPLVSIVPLQQYVQPEILTQFHRRGQMTIAGETVSFDVRGQRDQHQLGDYIHWAGGNEFAIQARSFERTHGPNPIDFEGIDGMTLSVQVRLNYGNEVFRAVPEPSAAVLLGLGLAALSRRRVLNATR